MGELEPTPCALCSRRSLEATQATWGSWSRRHAHFAPGGAWRRRRRHGRAGADAMRTLLQEEPAGDAGDMVVSFPDDYPNSVRHFLLIGFMGMLLGAGIFFYQGITREVNTMSHVLCFFIAVLSATSYYAMWEGLGVMFKTIDTTPRVIFWVLYMDWVVTGPLLITLRALQVHVVAGGRRLLDHRVLPPPPAPLQRGGLRRSAPEDSHVADHHRMVRLPNSLDRRVRGLGGSGPVAAGGLDNHHGPGDEGGLLLLLAGTRRRRCRGGAHQHLQPAVCVMRTEANPSRVSKRRVTLNSRSV